MAILSVLQQSRTCPPRTLKTMQTCEPFSDKWLTLLIEDLPSIGNPATMQTTSRRRTTPMGQRKACFRGTKTLRRRRELFRSVWEWSSEDTLAVKHRDATYGCTALLYRELEHSDLMHLHKIKNAVNEKNRSYQFTLYLKFSRIS
jgi:hypothetical protein